MNTSAILYLSLLILAGSLLLPGCQKEPSPEPQFNDFEEELEYLVDQYVKMGAAIGIVDQQHIQEFFFGRISANREDPPDSHSLFEIGSITKTFTATRTFSS